MTTNPKNNAELLAELRQFSGSEILYYNPLFHKFRYTEGVKYLAENAHCYWLLDMIFGNQYDLNLATHEFQTWKIQVTENHKAVINVEDGNNNILKTYNLDFTDFPLDEMTLWFTDRVLLLPSEY